MRTMWKGAVSFGLVSIPVNMYAATENNDVSLHQVHLADGGRIQYKRVCTVDGAEVPFLEIGKGHETSAGEMVILTDEDLANVPAVDKGIEVLEFLPLEAIDPVYFDRSYYLEPQRLAAKPYVLLRDALRQSGRVAIAKVVLRQREALSVLRVNADVLVLNTMLWPDEVRTPSGFDFLRDPSAQVRDQELKMAVALIDSLSEDAFDPAKYHDTYREALQDIIAAKVAGRDTSAPASAGADSQAVDLMTALRASVRNARHQAAADTDTEGQTGKTARKNPAKAPPATKKTQKKASPKSVPAPRTAKSTSVPKPRAAKRAPAGRQSKGV